MSIEDVARLTKIPSRTLKAIRERHASEASSPRLSTGICYEFSQSLPNRPRSYNKAYLAHLDRLLSLPKGRIMSPARWTGPFKFSKADLAGKSSNRLDALLATLTAKKPI